jgi:transposase
MANVAAPTYPAHGTPTAEARAQRREYWREVLKRWRKSGLSMAAFCKGDDLKDSTLNWWARQLRVRDCDRVRAKRAAAKPKAQGAARSAFVPVRVIQVASTEGAATLEVVTRSGHVIRLKPGFDPATLRRAVAALEGQP